MKLEQEPFEIVDHIVSLIDHPKDLLALALTSHYFKDIVIPDHIQSRQLICNMDRQLLRRLLDKGELHSKLRHICISAAYGQHSCYKDQRIPDLINDTSDVPPAKAAGTNVIAARKPLSSLSSTFNTILGQPTPELNIYGDVWDPVVPPRLFAWDEFSTHPAAEEYLATLSEVLLKTRNLSRFCIDVTTLPLPGYCDLFHSLSQGAPDLRELQVRLRVVHPCNLNILLEPLWRITSLTSLCIDLRHPPDANDSTEYGNSILDMIFALENLNDLYMDIKRPGDGPMHAGTFLQRANWKHIQRISLRGAIRLYYSNDSQENAKILRDFYTRHPTLKAISFRAPKLLLPLCLIKGILPNLTSVDCRATTLPRIYDYLPYHILQQLECLLTSAAIDVDVLAGMKSLKIFSGQVEGAKLDEIISALPNIERLEILPSLNITDLPSKLPARLDKLAKAFLKLKNLTHLAGIFTPPMSHRIAFTFDDLVKKDTFRRLAALPKLEELSVPNPKGSEQWLRFIRDDAGRCIKLEWDVEGTLKHPLLWGDFFRGYVHR